jgi:hypothetical protein
MPRARTVPTEVSATDTFDVWVFFDNEERSDTYAQPVGHCLECGAGLPEGGWPTRGVREGHLKRNVDL